MQRIYLVVLLGFLPLVAAADGKFYSRQTAVAANVTIPDQRALIHFTNGIERLVIETRFTGAGTNFAWVVPLPSQPVVEAASTGVFPTLQYLFQPQLIHDVPRLYLLFISLAALIYLVTNVRPGGRMAWGDVVACAAIALSAGLHVSTTGLVSVTVPLVAIFVFCLLIMAVALVRNSGSSSFVGILGLLLIGFLLATALLPALAPSRSASKSVSSASSPLVSILDRKLVGVFDTATISARDPDALKAWLRDNGFVVTTNSDPVIESYVKDGWIFVTTKVRRDQVENETSTPHPLSFTFKTERPVYPMRLTGVDNGPLDVELYVFGSRRAAAPHFKVERCTRPEYPEPPPVESWHWMRGTFKALNILHPTLRAWVQGAPVGTKLVAKLSPAQMREDIWLEWVDFSEKQNRLYSQPAARTIAMNWAGGLLAVSLVGWACAGRGGRDKHHSRLSNGVIVGGTSLALLVGGFVYLALPSTSVRMVWQPLWQTENNLFQLYQEMLGSTNATRGGLLAEAESILTQPQDGSHGLSWGNYAAGGRIRQEDSPGNFLLRQVSNEVEFVIFDSQGAEHVLPNRFQVK